MPPLLRILLHPSERKPEPAPLEVDMHRLALVGTLAWAAGLVACGIWWAVARTGPLTGPAMGTWICLAGVLLGFLAMRWARRHPKAGRNADVERPPGDDA